MVVDIGGKGTDLLGNSIRDRLPDIEVLFLYLPKGAEKFHEFTVDQEFHHGTPLHLQIIDIVEQLK
jgi:hypothetical protein